MMIAGHPSTKLEPESEGRKHMNGNLNRNVNVGANLH